MMVPTVVVVMVIMMMVIMVCKRVMGKWGKRFVYSPSITNKLISFPNLPQNYFKTVLDQNSPQLSPLFVNSEPFRYRDLYILLI